MAFGLRMNRALGQTSGRGPEEGKILMLKALIAACLALLLLVRSFVALAAEAQSDTPACAMTYAHARMIGESRAEADNRTRFSDFGGADAAAILKAINDGPPPRRVFIGERILVLEKLDSDNVRLVLFVGDCASVGTTMNENDWRKLKAIAFGEDY
jgi:hypothetical protein